MIISGEKKEEYRDIKSHYISRFVHKGETGDGKLFNEVKFRNGYHTDAPTVTLKCLGIEVRQGKPEWGAILGVEYFVIKLGEIKNIHHK